jgi:hypothetical protein
MFLTEAAFQLTIAAAGMAVMIHNTNSLIDDALAMGTGQYMANVASAVNTYVFDNMTVLAASPAGPTAITAGSVTAPVASPLHPTIQDLINLQLLPIGFSDVSPLGLSFKVDLTPTNCSAGLTNCTIPGVMYSTTAYRDSSGSVRTDQLSGAIATAGVDSGVSYAESPGVITGMAASWSAPNPLPGNQAGVLMMRVGNTSLLAQSMNQFYKRDGSLNLTGPMDANNQGMNRVGNFQSNGSVSAAGDVAAGSNVSGNGVYGNYVQSNGDLPVERFCIRGRQCGSWRVGYRERKCRGGSQCFCQWRVWELCAVEWGPAGERQRIRQWRVWELRALERRFERRVQCHRQRRLWKCGAVVGRCCL